MKKGLCSAPETKGKWVLPTAGILNVLATNLSVVNDAITKLNGTQLKNDNEHIWSSSEQDDHYVWVLCTVFGGNLGRCDKSSTDCKAVVRPIIEF